MAKNTKLLFGLGIIALIALFVLIAFAQEAFQNSLFEVGERYTVTDSKTEDITTDGPYGSQSSDPLVTTGVIVPPVRDGDPKKGATNPQLTIIEFGDFECSYCADFTEVLKQVLDTFPTVALVWKDLPNPVHFEARDAALAARCAQNQGKFWEYHDLLFLNQDLLGEELYYEIASLLELDTERFTFCYQNQVYLEIVGQGFDDANKYKVDGTPYLFVGNKRVDSYVSFEQLRDLVQTELQN